MTLLESGTKKTALLRNAAAETQAVVKLGEPSQGIDRQTALFFNLVRAITEAAWNQPRGEHDDGA